MKLNAEDKVKVMQNEKNQQVVIFIEKHLTFEERKRQNEMRKWVKEKKAAGINVEVGLGWIFFENKWIKWETFKNNKNKVEEDRV